MKQLIHKFFVVVLCTVSLNGAQAGSSTAPKASDKKSGGSTEDHLQTMMNTCLRMYKDQASCQQQIDKCRVNMGAAECQKIHSQMKK